jgi:hypothetical protein
MTNEIAARNPALQRLVDEGVQLKERILGFLASWPMKQYQGSAEARPAQWRDTSQQHQDAARALISDVRQWFNTVCLSTRT